MATSPETILTQKDLKRVEELFQQQRDVQHRKMDRMFSVLLTVQWIAAILVAIFISPHSWEGKVKVFHLHVYLAIFMGGGISLFPILLARFKPGWVGTRHVIAVSQMLWSALLIHLTGGRIETHFHVFVSLAFLAFYIDWPVLVTATLVVVADHLLRGFLYPESVYGIVNPEWWRFLEHAFWVVFEDIVLVWSCVSGLRGMRENARRQVEVEALSESNQLKTAALEMTLAEVQAAAKKG
jgi:two-component system, NtrC family, sensor histidine kinase HydH